jgi:hypothetical protein
MLVPAHTQAGSAAKFKSTSCGFRGDTIANLEMLMPRIWLRAYRLSIVAINRRFRFACLGGGLLARVRLGGARSDTGEAAWPATHSCRLWGRLRRCDSHSRSLQGACRPASFARCARSPCHLTTNGREQLSENKVARSEAALTLERAQQPAQQPISWQMGANPYCQVAPTAVYARAFFLLLTFAGFAARMPAPSRLVLTRDMMRLSSRSKDASIASD